MRANSGSRQKLTQPMNQPRLHAISTKITALHRAIASSENEDSKRRMAHKLAQLDPGNSVAFTTLLQLLTSTTSELVRKHTADNLKEILRDEQLPEVIASLQYFFSDEVSEYELEKFRDYYKILWHCAENLAYPNFYRLWHDC